MVVYASVADVVSTENDNLNVETCSSMLFVITVFDITVQSLVRL